MHQTSRLVWLARLLFALCADEAPNEPARLARLLFALCADEAPNEPARLARLLFALCADEVNCRLIRSLCTLTWLVWLVCSAVDLSDVCFYFLYVQDKYKLMQLSL